MRGGAKFQKAGQGLLFNFERSNANKPHLHELHDPAAAPASH